jgi:hypothetical protein
MNTPGYTADDALGCSSGTYRVSASWNPGVVNSSNVIFPSRWSWQNIWGGAVAQFVDPPAVLWPPTRPNCELSCGADRASCFRAGGSREICDHVQEACLMNCFFSLP